MKRILKGWKVWYENNFTFTSKTHKWEDIPQEGLQFLKQFWLDEDGVLRTENITGRDVFFLNNDMLESLRPFDKKIKIGKLLDDTVFGQLMKDAKADNEKITEMV